MESSAGHAIDGAADWLGTTFLYAGIFWRLHLHPPAPGRVRAGGGEEYILI